MSRFLVSLNPSNSSHLVTSDTIELAADFELSFKFATTDTSTSYFAFGASNNYIRISATGSVRFRLNDGGSSSTNNSATGFNDGQLHECIAKIESGVQTLEIDGSIVATENSPVTHVTWELDDFGVLGSNYWLDIIADIGVDDITEDEQYFWPIGNETSNTEISNSITLTYTNIPTGLAYRDEFSLVDSNANYLGLGRAVNGDFAAGDSDWAKGVGWTISTGEAHSDGTQVGDSDLSQTILTVDLGYRHTFSITDYTAGNIRVLLGDIGGAGSNQNAVGTFTEDGISGGDEFICRADLDFVGSIDDVECQRLLAIAFTIPASTQVPVIINQLRNQGIA